MQPTAIRNTASLKASFAFLLLLLGVSGQVPMARAQSLGTFSPTGSMTMPRNFHTATLLLDGRVLIAGGNYGSIAGGNNASTSTNSAELFDPSTGAFSPTGPMNWGRAMHTATLLADGKVLIAGVGTFGFGNNAPPNSAELYDPSTGTFTAIGDMAAAHPFATLLNNGKVLMSGGAPSSANAELYDPATGAFTATGDYVAPAALLTATLLADGRVLLTGCKPNCDSDTYANIAQLYDPATDTFSLTGSTADAMAIYEQTETSLPNGKVLFAGGVNDSGYPYRSAKLYDPSSGAFSGTGDMTKARESHTATLLPDGTVLITGGGLDFSVPVSPCCVGIQTADSYDPITGAFGSVTSMIAARTYHTATLLNDGRVLLAGGAYFDSRTQRVGPPNILASAEIYTPPNLVPTAALLAIRHADTGQVVSADNPAPAGEVIVINCTGFLDGSIIPPRIAVGGRAAEILSFGMAPGDTGLNQVTVHVPSGLAPGSAVPVRMNYLGRPSNEVTIGVQ
jgi:hypothetical protein